MQLLGDGRQDKVEVSYASSTGDSELMLHKLTSGAFQFGIGKDAKIVKQLSQVAAFGSAVQAEVAEWLATQGPARAMQEKISQDIHEASMSRPGDLDARLELIEQHVPGLKGEIMQMLDKKLSELGLVAAPQDAVLVGQTGGMMRDATQAELDQMVKSGLTFDPANPPKVWDPSGELAGSARALRDAPDITAEMENAREGRTSAMDLLEEEQENNLAGEFDDAAQMADEVAEEDPELVGAGAARATTKPAKRTVQARKARRNA